MVILLFILVFLGVLITGVNSVMSKLEVAISPTPTPAQVIFDKMNQNKIGTEPTTSPPKARYDRYPGDLSIKDLENKKAVVATNRGVIEFEIYPEATKAASNFVHLARDNFYDGLIFHRVVSGFVIQGGDPLGNGTGGPGYKFSDEPVNKSYDRGIVAMANSGPNTNGSQFFIMLDDNPTLPSLYTIFGKVIRGQEVVESIQVGDTMNKVSIENLQKE